MLYDGRGDYIRRKAPEPVPTPGLGLAALIAALLISSCVALGCIKGGHSFPPDDSFKLVFGWG